MSALVLTPSAYVQARVVARAAAVPVIAHSRRGHAANLVGAFGEVVFEHWLNAHEIEFAYVCGRTFDYRLAPRGVTVDVKTKDRTVPPAAHFDVSVTDYDTTKPPPDWYVFVSLQRARGREPTSDVAQYERAYLLGAYPGAAYHRDATFHAASTQDASNGMTFFCDCWNLPHAALRSLDDAARAW